MFRGLIVRLTLFNALVIGGILLVAAVGTYFGVSLTLDNGLDASLRESAQTLEQSQVLDEVFGGQTTLGGIVPARGESAEQNTVIVVPALVMLFDLQGNTLYRDNSGGAAFATLTSSSSYAAASTGQPAMTSVRAGEDQYRVLLLPVYRVGQLAGVAGLAASQEAQNATLAALKKILFIIGGIGVLLALIGGAALTTRGIRPIREAFFRQRAFIADASHQLKTPIAVVRADADALQRTVHTLPPEDAQILEDLVQESTFLSDLVGQLLAVARMEGPERVQSRQELFDLTQLTEETSHAVERVATEKGVHVKLDRADAPLHMRGDRTQIRLAMMALLDNAIKYNVPGGSVTMTVRRSGSWANIAIEDTGLGIEEEEQSRVWERFYRAPKVQGGTVEGAGLGLSIVREIVRRHGGRLLLNSSVGRGTTVTIQLALT